MFISIFVPDFTDKLFCGVIYSNRFCFLLTGIGHSMAKKLRTINILSVTDLLTCSQQILEKEFGNSLAVQMVRLCHGVDDSKVVPSGEFKSIGDEDSFKKCSTLDDARKRLKSLIDGLLPRVSCDTGIPQTVRVTVRKQDKVYKRGSRQCQIPNTVSFSDGDKTRNMLLTICLSLFNKLIDVKKPFHLTLLGVSLTNFQKSCVAQSKKISNFFASHSQPTWSASFATCSSQLLKDDQNGCKALNGPNDGSTKMRELQQSLVLTTQATQLNEKSTNGLNMRKIGPSTICPSNIDPAVFCELPSEIQKELQASWQQQGKGDKVAKKVKKCPGIQKYFASQSTSKSGN